jgi:hypothetical protein
VGFGRADGVATARESFGLQNCGNRFLFGVHQQFTRAFYRQRWEQTRKKVVGKKIICWPLGRAKESKPILLTVIGKKKGADNTGGRAARHCHHCRMTNMSNPLSILVDQKKTEGLISEGLCYGFPPFSKTDCLVGQKAVEPFSSIRFCVGEH